MSTRLETIRDYQERMNRVLAYIQKNLDAPLSLEATAGVACFSPFHFHRWFAAIVGEPLSRHVRRLRLERAALQLCQSDLAVTDIALAAGYETPSAFNKAFKQQFRCAPSVFKKRKRTVFTTRRDVIRITPDKESRMEPKIVERPEKTVVYVRRTGPYAKAAGEAWSAVCQFAYSHRLVSKAKGSEFIGISYDDPNVTTGDKLRYEACITVKPGVKGEGEVGVKQLEGGKFAMFLHKGPYEKFMKTYEEIFGRWLPESGAKLRDLPSFEVYLNFPGRTKPENLRTEIYVPIE